MKHSIKMILLSAIFQTLSGFGTCAPLVPGCWYILPKAGVAPTIFTDRESTLWTEPLNGFENTRAYDANNDQWPTNPPTGLNDVETILFDTGICLPKFKDAFSNRVLHIGAEVGYNLRDNCLAYADITYDRAHGGTVCFSIDRNNFGNPPADGDTSTTTSNFNQSFSTYHQFGAFLGARYYFDRCICNRFSFFLGNKIGIIHRRRICTNVLVEFEDEALSSKQINIEIAKDDNTVGGGVHLGIDICICDWLSAYIAAEVVAFCSLKTNRQIPIPIDGATLNYVVQPSHIIPAGSGTMLQFPVWIGLRYNWGCC